MEMKQLKRDASKVTPYLKELKNGTVVAVKECKIYIPARWRDTELAQLGNEIYILGIFMIVVDDLYYAINNITALMNIEPSSTNAVVIDGQDHIEFVFEAGDIIFPTTDIVKGDKLIYYIFDEIVGKGKVPLYLDYLDLGEVFGTSEKHAGVKLASTPTVLHMLLSMICRDSTNPNQFFRQVTDGKDLSKVMYIPLRSSTYGANNTTSRLLGSHFADNLTSALVNPSDREENIEHILRM